MNTIISFYTNKNIPVSHNALDSVKNACNRWNCHHILIDFPLQPTEFHDMFTKLYLYQHTIAYDRCLYLDTDMIINEEAANPFKLFSDETSFYVVKDMQQSFLSNELKKEFKKTTLCGPWYNECKKIIGGDLNYDYYMDGFFNAGFLLYTPKYHNILFERINSSLYLLAEEYKKIHQVEQALLNYTCMLMLGNNLKYIPIEWNYIDPPVLSENNKMIGNIYHFTGWYYQQYKPLLNNFRLWKKLQS